MPPQPTRSRSVAFLTPLLFGLSLFFWFPAGQAQPRLQWAPNGNSLTYLMQTKTPGTFDLHLFVIVALVGSFNRWPLGSFSTSPLDGIAMVHLGGAVFQTAVRLALPVIAVLLLIDLTLGLLNQINSRLQLLTLAFPTKIVAALALLYPVTLVAPRLFHDLAVEAQRVISLIIER